jgi:hypothetical protein
MTEIGTGRRALVLGLTLLTCACAANGSILNSDELYQRFDSNNDGSLTPEEWDDAFWKLDTNGDGFVSRNEFDDAFGGAP